jgi:guanine deaminase
MHSAGGQRMSAEDHMRRAIALSLDMMRSSKGGPFGAVVARGGQIIAEGFNQVTSNNDPTAHAEVVAIRLACQALGTFDLTGCEIYTSCEPCPMCLAALYWSRCDAVFYGNSAADAAAAGFDDSFLYDEVSRPPDRRKLPMKRLLADEAIENFNTWRAQTDKIEY